MIFVLPSLLARPLALREARRIAQRYLNGNIRRVGGLAHARDAGIRHGGQRAQGTRLRVLRVGAAGARPAAGRGAGAVEHVRCVARGEGVCEWRAEWRRSMIPCRCALGDMLTPASCRSSRPHWPELDLDGWLLFDFHGVNPVSVGMLATRRHADAADFRLRPAAWHAARHHARDRAGAVARLAGVVGPRRLQRVAGAGGRARDARRGHRIAMEYSPGDAVPYVDRVPAGVMEMVRQAGAVVVSSGELVSRFFAAWDAGNTAAHRRAAGAIAEIALDAFAMVGERAKRGRPLTEFAIQGWITDRMARAGMETRPRPIVAIGPNAAEPALWADGGHRRSSAVATCC